MELSITNYTPLKPIRVENMAELEKDLVLMTAHYTGLVLTEDQTTEAKKELANLRKFVKALNDERIRIKKEWMQPYEQLEADIKRLSAIVQEPIDAIDTQLKAFDDVKRQEKTEKILSLIHAEGMPAWVDVDMIWNPKWLNATVSMKAIDEEIVQKKMKIIGDMKTLETLPEYSWEAMEHYKRCLDLNASIAEGQRLLDIQKRKEEAQKAAETVQKPEPTEAEIQARLAQEPAPYAKEIADWIGFEAFLTASQAKALGAWFRNNGIKYRRPK